MIEWPRLFDYLANQPMLLGVVHRVQPPYFVNPEELHDKAGDELAEVFIYLVELHRETYDGVLSPFQMLLCASQRSDSGVELVDKRLVVAYIGH